MAESKLEEYQRKLAEARAAKPTPATPIEGLDVEVTSTGRTLTRTDQVLEPDEIQRRILATGEKQHPSIDLTEAQVTELCAFETEIKAALAEK